MRKASLILLSLWPLITAAQKTGGYAISVDIKPFAKQWVYLGYHFGNSLPINDSVKLDASGKGILKGAKKLAPGIYLIGYPSKKEYFEILVEEYQHFSITVKDTADINSSIVIKDAPDAGEFQSYQLFMKLKGDEVAATQKKLATASGNEKVLLKKQLTDINRDVQNYRDKIKAKNPASLLASIFRLLTEPVVPEAGMHPGGKYDSTFAWYYYKYHFWDGVDFTDERLLRTPVFERRFDQYFKEVIFPKPDSLKAEAGKVLMAAEKNKEMFQFILSKLIQRYINPEYMGQDAVFLYLFEKYIAPGKADWYNEKQKKYIFDRAYSLMGNLIGEKAAPLEMVDTAGIRKDLYDINAGYIVICFWDPGCGHCKEVVPKLDSVFEASWKAKGVVLYGVLTEGSKDNWVQYINKHNLKGWVHVYETENLAKSNARAGKPGYRQLYDVITTPKLYLLNKDKNIIAKQLTWDQLDAFLQNRVANQ